MASLCLSVGLTCYNNLLGRSLEFSPETCAKGSLYFPSRFCYRRKQGIKPSRIKAKYDDIPKQFREENLKDGVKEYFKNVPEIVYGLPFKQLEKLMDGDTNFKRQAGEVDAESLSMSSYYDMCFSKKYSTNSATTASAYRYSEAASGGYRRQQQKSPPPDMPSLLLSKRIIYLNLPLYSEITELFLAELFYLQNQSEKEPIFLYLDSSGTQNEMGEAVTLEYDAYAIADMLNSFVCKKYTLNISEATGQIGMLLSLGTKGYRFTQPGGLVQLHLPKAIPEGGQSTDMWIRAKELVKETDIYLEFLSQGTGKTKEELANDLVKPRVFTANEAIQYGIIDKILPPKRKAIRPRRQPKEGRERIDLQSWTEIAEMASAERAKRWQT